ncbi:hypothetical protein MYX82_04790 [Acidobacteria bacterium AH-259-D05]|nr:hypothetical protein [Acidobacteria bacterium AH-259-D05]
MTKTCKIKIFCCCILLLSQGAGLLGISVLLPTQRESEEPDLNLLVERVTQFWSLLQKGRKAEALDYVDPATRNTFLKKREAKILAFTIRDIHPGDDPTEVQVMVEVELHPAISSHSVTVPITERYVFRQGTWFVHIAESKVRELFSPSKAKAPADSQKEPVER